MPVGGLTEAATVVSVWAVVAVYWSLGGRELAAGLVISIYIHEMGHVFRLKKYGIGAGAPLFIPGIGALVMLKEHPADAHIDAEIGHEGPN